jgi:hypothetical protein
MPPPLQPPCVEERLLDMSVGQMAGGEPSQLVPYPIDVVNPEQKRSLHLGRWPDDAEYHIFHVIPHVRKARSREATGRQTLQTVRVPIARGRGLSATPNRPQSS